MVETEKETGKKHRSRVTPTEGEEDIYVGTLATNGKANGNGKYLWCDGCMYSGHWDNGKANGNGKFSWPSGATYEGQFLDGKMDGKGTFTGVNGETYKGNWVGGVREGEGEKWYSNGDYYSGRWRDDAIDGVGKYVWSNGDWYKGEWQKDEICGKGVMVWKDGKRVEGVWVNGECQMVSGSGLGRVCPKVCVGDCERESGDIVDGYVDSKVVCKKDCEFVKGDVMKSGEIICKGDKNYDLMICLQLGISFSLEKYSLIARELRSSDFDPMAKFWTKFPPEGSKLTPSHKSTDFRWKDYCPMVFKNLRNLFKVDPSDYMLSICGNDGLRELSSPGKSGSFFYLTQNERFMIKTVKKSEVKVLLRMLTPYYKHVRRHENSLLTRFYGMHCVKPTGGPKTRFIVMGNLFSSECRIHRRFDLKGSRHGRTVEKTEGEIDETTTLKDLDLDFVFRLESNWYQELIKQIARDCEFLEAERIMDYSLLVGVHFRNEKSGDTIGLPPFILRGKEGSYPNKLNLRGQHSLEAELQDIDRVLDVRARLGSNMPAKAERLTRKSNADKYIPGGYGNLSFSRNGEVYEVILYFGIIDILQDYVMSKRLERAYKSLQVDPNSISAVDPKLYSKRFRDFIGTIFVED